MKENKNQEVLQDAIMKALDDAELEGVDGGISKRTMAEIAGAAALAGVIAWAGIAQHNANSLAGQVGELAGENADLIVQNADLKSENQKLGEKIGNQRKEINRLSGNIKTKQDLYRKVESLYNNYQNNKID